ncbi:MAG: hypothetical protein ACE5FM_04690 [Methyloligellaceae bacterium]
MLDKILVFISLVALIAFVGVVVGFVAEPDLVIVMALMIALATHDFWISVFKPKNGSTPQASIPLESLPTGVSGKPAVRRKSPAKKKSAAKKTSRRKASAKRKK